MNKCVCAVLVAACCTAFTVSATNDGDQSLQQLEVEANCAYITVFARESILASLDNVPFNDYMKRVAEQAADESQKALHTNIARQAYEYVDQEGKSFSRYALSASFQSYWNDKCMQTSK